MSAFKKYYFLTFFLIVSDFASSQSLETLKYQLSESFKKEDYKNALIIAEKIKTEISKLNGIESKEYAVALNDLGSLYFLIGEFTNAEVNYLEVLRIKKKVLEPGHPSYAKSLNDLGNLYSTVGDYKKAEPYLLEALIINKNVFGTDNPKYVIYLNDLGLLYTDMGNPKKAEPYFLEAMSINKKTLGIEHPNYATSLYYLGSHYSEMGDFKKAEAYLVDALTIRKKKLGIEHPDYSSSLTSLGLLYSEMGDFKKAESYLLEALNIDRKILGTEDPEYATCLNNLGSLYFTMGDYKKAESYFLEVLTIRKNFLGTEHPDYATSLDKLGRLYSAMGDFKKAESYLLSALVIRKKVLGTEHPDYAISLNDLGVLYSGMGDYKKAEAYHLEVTITYKKIFGSEHPEYATSLNNLGVLYSGMGDYKKAEPYLLEDLTINKKIFGTEHPHYATSLNNLGVLYSDMGDYKKAEPYILEALAIRKKVLGTENPDYAGALSNLGTFYYSIGDYKKAEIYLLESLSIREKIFGMEHPEYVTLVSNLGLLYYQMKNVKKSFDYIRQVLLITNKNIQHSLDFLNEQEMLNYISKFSKEFNFYHSLYFYSYPHHLSETLTIYNSELQNKGLVLHSSLLVRNAIYKSKDSNLINNWNQLLINKQQLYKAYSLPKDKYPNNIKQLEEETQALEKQLVTQSEGYRKLNEQKQIDFIKVQQHLKPNEAALEFVSFPYYSQNGWTDSVLYTALVLRPGYSQPKYVYLFEKRQLSSILNKKEDAYEPEFIKRLYLQQKESNPLYQLIWKPLDSLLQGVTTIYVASSGLLHTLALGAIPTPDGNTISNKYGLQILGTTGDIINKKEDFIDVKSIQQAIVFGGINYDKASSRPIDFASNANNNVYAYVPIDSVRGSTGKWDFLRGTQKEAEEIINQFKKQKITTHFYSDSTATETLFKNMPLNSKSVLHIATHGYFFPDVKKKSDEGMQLIGEEKQSAFKVSENPLLRSGLIFAGANPAWTNPDYVSTATDDGILTAYEISNMDLSNVKLVVMSACETGLGDIKGSEGVFGLQRAFKLAGVKNIIMSLWKVPDEKTRELMQMFYQNCFEGKSISKAFKSAQSEMKNKYPTSPYYWAGFMLLE